MNWTTIIIVAIFLIACDKMITVANIHAVEKNYPGKNGLDIEKNPIQKWLFEKTGLFWGAVLCSVVSLLTFFFAMYMFSFPASAWAPDNKWGVAFYVMVMAYGFVLFNNLYFFLRYSKLL